MVVTYLCLEGLLWLCGLGIEVRKHLRVIAPVLLLGGAAAHHLEHRGAARADEPYDECRGDQQEDDVEDGGVVPGDAGVGDFGCPIGGDEPEATEGELDDVTASDHGGVEDPKQGQHHLGAVVLPVDDQDRDDDQVGEDEGDDAAEADPAVP